MWEKLNDQQMVEKVIDTIGFIIQDSIFKETAEAFYSYHMETNAHVYFLKNEDNGYIKIGCTKNLKKRIAILESGLKVYGYEPNFKLLKAVKVANEFMYEAERELHEKFSSKRCFGEWFRISLQDINDYYDDWEIEDEYPNYHFDMREYTENKFKSLLAPLGKVVLGDCYFLNSTTDEIKKIVLWAESVKFKIEEDGYPTVDWVVLAEKIRI